MTSATGVQAEAELDRLTALVGVPVIGPSGRPGVRQPDHHRDPPRRPPLGRPRSSSHLAALIDFEYARVADPLFDAATFGWLTLQFHPARAEAAWAAFAEAAGIAAGMDKAGTDEAGLRATLGRLRLLRILGLVHVAGRRGPAMRDRWLSLLAADAAARHGS